MMRDVYSASTTLYVLVSEDSSQMESYSTLSTNFNVSQQIANDISQLIMSTRVRRTPPRHSVGTLSGATASPWRAVTTPAW